MKTPMAGKRDISWQVFLVLYSFNFSIYSKIASASSIPERRVGEDVRNDNKNNK